jgi:hypothetical protein
MFIVANDDDDDDSNIPNTKKWRTFFTPCLWEGSLTLSEVCSSLALIFVLWILHIKYLLRELHVAMITHAQIYPASVIAFSTAIAMNPKNILENNDTSNNDGNKGEQHQQQQHGYVQASLKQYPYATSAHDKLYVRHPRYCYKCSMSFNSKRSLRDHMAEAHSY